MALQVLSYRKYLFTTALDQLFQKITLYLARAFETRSYETLNNAQHRSLSVLFSVPQDRKI